MDNRYVLMPFTMISSSSLHRISDKYGPYQYFHNGEHVRNLDVLFNFISSFQESNTFSSVTLPFFLTQTELNGVRIGTSFSLPQLKFDIDMYILHTNEQS